MSACASACPITTAANRPANAGGFTAGSSSGGGAYEPEAEPSPGKAASDNMVVIKFSVPHRMSAGQSLIVPVDGGRQTTVDLIASVEPGVIYQMSVPIDKVRAAPTTALDHCSIPGCHGEPRFTDQRTGKQYCSPTCLAAADGFDAAARAPAPTGTTASGQQRLGQVPRGVAFTNSSFGMSSTAASRTPIAQSTLGAGASTPDILGMQGMLIRQGAPHSLPPALTTQAQRQAARSDAIRSVVAQAAGSSNPGRPAPAQRSALPTGGVRLGNYGHGVHGYSSTASGVFSYGANGKRSVDPTAQYDAITAFDGNGHRVVPPTAGAFNVSTLDMPKMSWRYDEERKIRSQPFVVPPPSVPGSASALPPGLEEILVDGVGTGRSVDRVVRNHLGTLKVSSAIEGTHYRDINSSRCLRTFIRDWRSTTQQCIVDLQTLENPDVAGKIAAQRHWQSWLAAADMFEATFADLYKLVVAPTITMQVRLERADKLFKYVNIVLCIHHYSAQMPGMVSVFIANFDANLYNNLDCFDLANYPRPVKRSGFLDKHHDEERNILRAYNHKGQALATTKKSKPSAATKTRTESTVVSFDSLFATIGNNLPELTVNQRNAMIKRLQQDGDAKIKPSSKPKPNGRRQRGQRGGGNGGNRTTRNGDNANGNGGAGGNGGNGGNGGGTNGAAAPAAAAPRPAARPAPA